MDINEVNIEISDQRRKHVLLRLFISLGLLISIMLAAFFMYLQFINLLILTVIGFCLFGLAFFLLIKKRYFSALQLGVVAIVVNSVVDSYFLGWSCYFWLNLITMAILVINSYSIKMALKIAEVVLISLLFFALLFLTMDGNGVYGIDPEMLDAIRLFNIISIVVTLFFMQFYNFRENEILQKRFADMSEIDMLTGAHNRRFFNKYLEIEIKRLTSRLRYGNESEVNLGIAMIDIDNFKHINDTYGHLFGDGVLAETARAIKATLFERDVFCRYGGEEFVVLFTNTMRPGAVIAVEKIRKTVEEYQFRLGKKLLPTRLTVSIGFASYDEEADVYRLLNLADTRLYEAKRRGKNNVVSA